MSDKTAKANLPPCLDTYVLKSKMLREVLENVVQSRMQKSEKRQWEIVREVREKILTRIEAIEKG
jgi:hypothetical protein